MKMTTSQTNPNKLSFLLVSLVAISHFILAFFIPLGADEAHYALYGLMPDWSYFDHPPLVGWLQIIPMWLAPFDWAARIVPILLFILLNYLLLAVTHKLYPSKDSAWLGFWLLILLNTGILFNLMGFGMLPDNPLIVITLAIILVVSKILERNRLIDWGYLGILVGLAALAKYTAITLVASLLLIMLMEKRWFWLRQKGLYLAILIASLLITPILYWNNLHDWASFVYQLEHGTNGSSWSLERLARSQAIQFLVYSPLLYLVGWWSIFKPANYLNPAPRLLLAFSLPIMFLFAYTSGYEESLPHWVALAWLLLIPIVVNHLWQKQHSKWLKPIVALHLTFNIGLIMFAHSLLVTPWVSNGNYKNPLDREYGWDEVAKVAKTLQAELKRDNNTLPLFVPNWSYGSHLSWSARPEPVYIANQKQTQFPYWYGSPKAGMNGLLIVPHYDDIPPVVGKPYHFESCQHLKQVNLQKYGKIVVGYHFYKCTNYQESSK